MQTGRRALAIGAAALLAGCSEQTSGDGDWNPREYKVRGVVAEFPTAADPSLTLTHEAVPEFVDRAGDSVGLDSMTLPFPLAAGVELPDLEVGDPVEVTLRVDWESERPFELTAVRELPPGTEHRRPRH